jgi:Zn-finger nucleic acid-binding protein
MGLSCASEKCASGGSTKHMRKDARKPQSPYRVPDDRGIHRAVVDTSRLVSDVRMADPRFAAIVERASRLDQLGAKFNLSAASLVIFFFTIVALVVLAASGTVTSGFGMSVIVATGLVLTSVVSPHPHAQRALQGRTRALLEGGICPCCGYSLALLPPESDGCLVCPECGSAWRSERIHGNLQYAQRPSEPPAFLHIAATLWRDGTAAYPGVISDDAGVDQPLVSPRLSREIDAASGEHRQRIVAAAKRMSAAGAVVRWCLAGLMLAFGTAPQFSASSSLSAPNASRVAVLFFIFFAAMAISVLRSSAGITGKRVRAEMLFEGLCPSCATDLRSAVPAEVTGLISCPRCTATWNPQRRYHSVPPE